MAKITFSVDKNGIFKYSPGSCVEVNRNEKIEWVYFKDDPVALHFGVSSPLNEGHPHGKKTLEAKVKDKAEHGIYKYFVAVFDGENILIDDPVLIIPPPS